MQLFKGALLALNSIILIFVLKMIFTPSTVNWKDAPGFSLALWNSTPVRFSCACNGTVHHKILSLNDILDSLQERLLSRMENKLKNSENNRQKYTFLSSAIPVDEKVPLLIGHEGIAGVGLGNYLFWRASLMGSAWKSNRIPVIIRQDTKDHFFESPPLEFQPEIKFTSNRSLEEATLNTYAAAKFDPILMNLSGSAFANRSAIIDGYLQSWLYFDDHRDEIQAAFTVKRSIQLEAIGVLLSYLSDLFANRTFSTWNVVPTLIGIHVRRGDIINAGQRAFGHVPASEEYLLRMVHHYERKYFPAIFVVVSDDAAYCKRLFREDNFVFMLNTYQEEDLAVMCLMDEVIITVGSFGFWCAYLNVYATEVSYFKRWPAENSSFAKEFDRSQYFLPTWFGRD